MKNNGAKFILLIVIAAITVSVYLLIDNTRNNAAKNIDQYDNRNRYFLKFNLEESYIVINIEIRGKIYKFIVDTGSPSTRIDFNSRDKVNMTYTAIDVDSVYTGNANEKTVLFNTDTITIDGIRFNIGKIYSTDLAGIIRFFKFKGLTEPIGVLGNDFILYYVRHIDIDNKIIILK